MIWATGRGVNWSAALSGGTTRPSPAMAARTPGPGPWQAPRALSPFYRLSPVVRLISSSFAITARMSLHTASRFSRV